MFFARKPDRLAMLEIGLAPRLTHPISERNLTLQSIDPERISARGNGSRTCDHSQEAAGLTIPTGRFRVHTDQLVWKPMIPAFAQHQSKVKLLDAMISVVRAKGYNATRVEDVCEAAGLTKGSFFHHFKSKDELALAAVEHWNQAARVFAAAAYHEHADPLDRLLGYVDFRKSLLKGSLRDYTCFVGTIISEAYDTHPELRAACERDLTAHAEKLEPDIREAMQRYGVSADWTAKSLALHMQTVVQGAFVLAKAKGSADVAAQSFDHLRRYVENLFRPQAVSRAVQPAVPTRIGAVRARKSVASRVKGTRK
jgi:TetR/AcrR family transcriptional repressor of nem operon